MNKEKKLLWVLVLSFSSIASSILLFEQLGPQKEEVSDAAKGIVAIFQNDVADHVDSNLTTEGVKQKKVIPRYTPYEIGIMSDENASSQEGFRGFISADRPHYIRKNSVEWGIEASDYAEFVIDGRNLSGYRKGGSTTNHNIVGVVGKVVDGPFKNGEVVVVIMEDFEEGASAHYIVGKYGYFYPVMGQGYGADSTLVGGYSEELASIISDQYNVVPHSGIVFDDIFTPIGGVSGGEIPTTLGKGVTRAIEVSQGFKKGGAIIKKELVEITYKGGTASYVQRDVLIFKEGFIAVNEELTDLNDHTIWTEKSNRSVNETEREPPFYIYLPSREDPEMLQLFSLEEA